MTLTPQRSERPRRTARRAALLVAAAALPAALVVPAAPAAATPVTKTFTTGANQRFVVPAHVTRLTVRATGEPGRSAIEGGAGGTGATVTATLTVAPGTTYYVNVGTGGGAVTGQQPGGSGGGASDVRTCSSARASCALTGVRGTDPRLIVAAGGGGGGGGSSFTGFPVREATGGDAGDTGKPGGRRPDSGGGGGGGTQALGGKGGAACPEDSKAGSNKAGSNGTPGTGGTGGGGFGGGGGGGGWHGGGGGGGCFLINADGTAGPGGGGGGSNLVPAGGISGPATGSAQVSITYGS
ncbi:MULTISPECIES: hypothetical protein [unclassified Streptomyces]|uniref:hypothetical protein n=1 Tax=unclassified Streptomyces TaxID=2593676 RepID=UPI001446D62C|nr:hypothetical protein [Streptomyces sp. A1136]